MVEDLPFLPSYYLVGLNRIRGYHSSTYVVPPRLLRSAFLSLLLPLVDPWREVIPPVSEGAVAWQPRSLSSPEAEGEQRYITGLDERNGVGTRFGQNKVQDHACKCPCVTYIHRNIVDTSEEQWGPAECDLRSSSMCDWDLKGSLSESLLQTHGWLFLARRQDAEILATLFIGLQPHLSALRLKQAHAQRGGREIRII